MATYVVGDIHGCHQTFMDLLKLVEFSDHDQLWLVGDLVNNGPSSASVVRWAMDHSDQVVSLLGNHDLHLLAVAFGAKPLRKKDTFQDMLEAPDRDALVSWLLQCKMFHHDKSKGAMMVHAGLLPTWSTNHASTLAREVEAELQQSSPAALKAFFEAMYGNEPRRDGPSLSKAERMRLTVNVMTRMRALSEGALEFKFKGTLAQMPQHLVPWFKPRNVRDGSDLLFFGHWSAIGYMKHEQIHALDSGCTWGRELTAYRLDDGELFSVAAHPDEVAQV